MQIQKIYIPETDSTNHVIRQYLQSGEAEGLVVYTDFQSSGKGQTGNHWESEAGQNLLFSLLLKPVKMPVTSQFLVSMLVSVAVVQYLRAFAPEITIKWPNDIYFQNKKLGGILIENSWQGSQVASSIIGIGLNINQTEFTSDAPNPVSLKQITGKDFDREELLDGILQQIDQLYVKTSDKEILRQYHELLFRKEGYFAYQSDDEVFDARIEKVEPDGRLVLITSSNERKAFYFKEVSIVI